MSTETQPSTICELFQAAAAQPDEAVAFRHLDGSVALTWDEYRATVRHAATGLAALGVGRGDTVALWLTNRPEFHVADAGALHLGAAGVSIYATYTVDQAAHVIGDAGARVLVTEPAFLERALAVREQGATDLETIVLVGTPTPDTVTWDELLAIHTRPGFDFDASWQTVDPDDLATVIYTSGTTGVPKGVELTHRNILFELRGVRAKLDYPAEARMLSYLPMAHIAERIMTHYIPMAVRAEVTPVPDARTVAEYLPSVRPQVFFSPPRLWEKLRSAALAVLGGDPGAGDDVDAEKISAVRARLGFEDVQTAVVGAAPCPPPVIAFWRALGIPLAEVYGLSENTGAATIGAPPDSPPGSAGRPLDGVEVRLGDNGEVLIRGPIVMRGYRNNPQATAATIDRDGWLHSGDVGRIDEQGNLWIVDRIKEIIINASGKNMSPAHIEATLKSSSPLISQACVIGDARPYNVALLTLDADAARALAAARSLASDDVEGLAQDPIIRTEIQSAVDRANDTLARVEQIKRYAIIAEDWLPGGEELTPTMKLKRRVITDKYAAQIEAIYEGDAESGAVAAASGADDAQR
jgi:long-subunit acyl-CoA synthetase (AMP-forming)